MDYARRNLFYFLVLGPFLFNISNACFWTPKFHVDITNEIPNSNILLRCQSKDDDIGYHNLTYKGNISWKFCEHFYLTTLYFCHSWWQSKQQVFDVMNFTMFNACNEGKPRSNRCQWSLKPEGIYWHDPTQMTWLKQYDWR